MGGLPILKNHTAVTQVNMKISAVDGTSFVDFSASAFSADNIRNNDWVEIFDSSKRKIGGFIKAAGTGETTGDELIGAANFVTAGFWSDVSGVTFGTPSGSNTFTGGGAGNPARAGKALLTNYKLYKAASDISISTGTMTIADHIGAAILSKAGTGDFTGYFTWIDGSARMYYWLSVGSGGVTMSGGSIRQVLTPSSTGVTITNTPGGATYNWGVKDANFNYNDASGYTYRIISRQAYGTLILGQDVTSGTLHIATKDGETMFFHDSIDFSAYAGDDAGVTPYTFVFEDAAGKVARAYGGAQGGGESLDTNLILNSTDWTGGNPPTSWTNGAGGDASYLAYSDAGRTCLKITNGAGSNYRPYQNVTTTVGSLYKFSDDFKHGDTVTGAELWGGSTHDSGNTSDYFRITGMLDADWTTYTSYLTAKTTLFEIGLWGLALSAVESTKYNLHDSTSLQKYLDIPTTGLHLVSAMGGTTRNMARTDSGFDPNTVVKVRVYRTGQTDTTAGALLDDAGLFLLDDASAILTED
jgi:hypothetical protein